MLAVLPHRPQLRQRLIGRRLDQGPDPECPARLELVPFAPGRPREFDGLAAPPPRLLDRAPARLQERAAARILRSKLGLVIGGLAPLVEQPMRHVESPGAQFELDPVHADHRVRGEISTIVCERTQRIERRPSARQLSAPEQPLGGDPLGRCRDVPGRISDDRRSRAQVRHLSPTQRASPRERPQRISVDARLVRAL